MEELSPVDKFYIWHAAELKDLEENGPRVRRGRKPSKKQYFTYITDKAIIAYNNEESWSKRNRVFKEFINLIIIFMLFIYCFILKSNHSLLINFSQ